MGSIFLTARDFEALFDKKAHKKSKYNAERVEVRGEQFDSSIEGRRYAALLLMERSGEICELRRQVPYELIPAQREPDTVGPRGGVRHGKCIERAVFYYADFTYRTKDGALVVEDTKGVRTADYVIKRKLMLHVHGIRIKEIREA